MPFCNKCGNKLEPGDLFCGVCGSPAPLVSIIDEDAGPVQGPELDPEPEPEPEPEAKTEPEATGHAEKVKHCPACGEIVGEREYVCGSCGFELRQSSDGSINDLYQKLEQIENSRPEKERGTGDTTTDKKLATAIIMFPIPNTKEDLTEFLVMANANSCWADSYAANKAVPSAWRSKYDQAVSKYELKYGDTAELRRFKALKDEGEKERALRKRKQWGLIALVYCVAILALILLALFSNAMNGK